MASPISATAGLCRRAGSSRSASMRTIFSDVVDAPLPELDQHAGADAEHHVGLAPEVAAERQRDAQRIAAVEHAAAAPIAEHRRLQHRRQCSDLLGDASCAPPPQTISGFFAAPRSFAALRIAVSSMLGWRSGRGGCGVTGADLPHTSIAHCSDGRAGPAGGHRPHRLGDKARRLLGLADQRRVIDQPLDDAGLVADLMQVAEVAADVGVGNFADQRQHRRVHRIGGEEGGGRVEQARPRHHGIGLGLAGRERRAERHIGRALLVAGVDGPHPVAGAVNRASNR